MQPVMENLGVLFFLMKSTWSTEPGGCSLLLPLLGSQCSSFMQVLQKGRFLLQAQGSNAPLWLELHLPVTRSVFKHGILASTHGNFQQLCSALGFTLGITVSQVRPMPRAIGNLILMFFCCCGFMGRSSGYAQV